MKKSVLKKYAKLVVRTGANVQKGQDVIIMAELEQKDFVLMLVEEAYKAKANRVTIDWLDDDLNKLHYKYRSVKSLSTMEQWEIAKFQYYVEKLPVRIYVESADPDGERGIDQRKRAEAGQNLYKITKPFRDDMENRYQWTIVGAAGTKWAKKLFPELSPKKAKEKLWDAILQAAHGYGDPIANWNKHNVTLHEKASKLNNLGLVSLHYTSKNGTNLTVGLIPEAKFLAGGEKALGSGIPFNPNMPTEECFTTPRKGQAEGKVIATMPLSYRGEVIDGFWFEFKDGKVVKFGAEKNEALLKQMLEMDENAGYMGEVALVPKESPINQMGILFYSTLFDENASCHIALGMGYSNTVRDYYKYTLEELREMGVNDSMIHVDFMIGSDDMHIVGTTQDGRKVTIFKDGTWAI